MSDGTIWYAITDAAGNLMSTGTVIADDEHLAANGLSKIALAGDPNGMVWNVPTRSFVAPPAPPTVLTPFGFISRFTADEFAAITEAAKTDGTIRFLLYKIERATEIMPSDAEVQQGLGYLTYLNIITAERAAKIGAE